MSSYQISRRFSLFLDAARTLAALAVVAQHARTYLFVGPKALRDPSRAVRAFYFLTGFGHEAVMVFFVLSGFLVGGSALSAIERDRWSWSDYLVKRVQSRGSATTAWCRRRCGAACWCSARCCGTIARSPRA
ncbi:MAG TPA: acyltransferase family protein [Candidatus Elarobacter sp.]|nr:acyltransferase family protein [Candidatus Elarobacter sp.]